MDSLSPAKIRLLGVEFSDVALPEVLEFLRARPPDARFGYLVTPNADHFDRVRRIPALRVVYVNAMLCLLDSQAIHLVSRWVGLPCARVVTGADLTAALLPHLAGLRVAVIGMRPAAFAMLKRRNPDIDFVHHNPPMGLLENPAAFHAACEFARNAQARFIFIALGSPLQELMAYAILRGGGVTGIGLCIGSALNFAAGAQPRAPLWMRERGLEWLHRLIQNPTRMAGRYLLDDPNVILSLLREGFRQKTRQ